MLRTGVPLSVTTTQNCDLRFWIIIQIDLKINAHNVISWLQQYHVSYTINQYKYVAEVTFTCAKVYKSPVYLHGFRRASVFCQFGHQFQVEALEPVLSWEKRCWGSTEKIKLDKIFRVITYNFGSCTQNVYKPPLPVFLILLFSWFSHNLHPVLMW